MQGISFPEDRPRVKNLTKGSSAYDGEWLGKAAGKMGFHHRKTGWENGGLPRFTQPGND